MINFIIDIIFNKSRHFIIFTRPTNDIEVLSELIPGDVRIVNNISEFHNVIVSLVTSKENTLYLISENILSIDSLERSIEKIISDDHIENYLSAFINASEVKKAHVWSIGILSILFHTFAHSHGIVFRMSSRYISDLFKKRLIDFNFFNINDLFLWNDISSVNRSSNQLLSFGIKIFEKENLPVVYKEFLSFSRSIRERYYSYLDQYVSHTHHFQNQTRKPLRVRQTYYMRILDIVKELCENAVYHSKGIGYLGAEIYGDHLHLFIGDAGIGLTTGILNNYDMPELISNSEDALNNMFILGKHGTKRKKKTGFDLGGGEGLHHTLNNIFTCHGKFIIRTGSKYAVYANPVEKIFVPKKIYENSLKLLGTQYMIILPINSGASKNTPKGKDQLRNLEGAI